MTSLLKINSNHTTYFILQLLLHERKVYKYGSSMD